MFGSSRNTSPSGWQLVGNKGTFNVREGCLHNWPWFHWVIIKFLRRKDCKQVSQVKKDLKDLNTDGLDLPKGTKIFVNQNLCPYYPILWYKSKRLRSMGIINSFYVSGGTVKFKITENSRPLAITHLICHHHQNHHSLGFATCCVHVKYILLLRGFFYWV